MRGIDGSGRPGPRDVHSPHSHLVRVRVRVEVRVRVRVRAGVRVGVRVRVKSPHAHPALAELDATCCLF